MPSLDTRYELVDKIGQGSFATVYRARDNELGREVAIKQIHQQYLDEPRQLDLYWGEAQLLASLQHPNIVTMFDIDRDRGWLIMELMQANLADRMEGRQMDLRALRATLAHGLRALKYLHARGVVHGDIKTANLMIDARRRVKIGDFGLARRVSDEDGSLIKGTTKYMAPEVVDESFGEVGPSSDLYSLGFCAYELMCGPQFEDYLPGLNLHSRNKQIAWMMWHAAPDRKLPEIPRVLSGVPDDLAGVIGKLIEKDQSKRYQSAAQALDDLNVDSTKSVIAKDEITGDSEESSEVDPEEAARKKRLMLAGGAFGISLLLTMLVLFWPSGSGGGDKKQAPVGFVYKLDEDKKSVLYGDAEEGAKKTLKIIGEPKVKLTNIKDFIHWTELKVGDRISWVVREESGKKVMEITAWRPILNTGKITSMKFGEGRREVSIVLDDAGGDSLNLDVPPRAKIMLNGEKVDLDKLKIGDEVEFTHLVARKGKGHVLVTLKVLRREERVGFLNQINWKEKTVTIGAGPGAAFQEHYLPIADNVRIVSDTGEGEGFVLKEANETLADVDQSILARGDRLRYRFDSQIREVFRLRAKERLTRATVFEVRSAKNEIEVTGTDGKNRTLTISAQTALSLNHEGIPSRRIRLFRKNDYIDVLYDPKDDAKPTDPIAAVSCDVFRRSISDRAALIVGVQSYRNTDVPELPVAMNSARQIRQALQSRYAVDKNLMVFSQNPGVSDLKADVKKLTDRALDLREVVVYICCHAFRDGSGKIVLALRDFDPEKPAESGLALGELLKSIGGIKTKSTIVLLDCSHTGVKTKLSVPSTAIMLQSVKPLPAGMIGIASCDRGQKGHHSSTQTSRFADAIARGYAGEADPDADLRIPPRELWQFADQHLSRHALPGGGVQRPVLVGGM